MKKLTLIALGIILVLSSAGCNETAKTGAGHVTGTVETSAPSDESAIGDPTSETTETTETVEETASETKLEDMLLYPYDPDSVLNLLPRLFVYGGDGGIKASLYYGSGTVLDGDGNEQSMVLDGEITDAEKLPTLLIAAGDSDAETITLRFDMPPAEARVSVNVKDDEEFDSNIVKTFKGEDAEAITLELKRGNAYVCSVKAEWDSEEMSGLFMYAFAVTTAESND